MSFARSTEMTVCLPVSKDFPWAILIASILSLVAPDLPRVERWGSPSSVQSGLCWTWTFRTFVSAWGDEGVQGAYEGLVASRNDRGGMREGGEAALGEA